MLDARCEYRESGWAMLHALPFCCFHQILGADSVPLGDTRHRELQTRPILPGQNIRELLPTWANTLKLPNVSAMHYLSMVCGEGCTGNGQKVRVVPVALDTRRRIRRSYSAIMPTPRSQYPFRDRQRSIASSRFLSSTSANFVIAIHWEIQEKQVPRQFLNTIEK